MAHGPFLCTSKKSFLSSPELPGSNLKTEIPSALHLGLSFVFIFSRSPWLAVEDRTWIFLSSNHLQGGQTQLPQNLDGLWSTWWPPLHCSSLSMSGAGQDSQEVASRGWVGREGVFPWKQLSCSCSQGWRWFQSWFQSWFHVLRDFLCLVLTNFMKMKLSPDLDFSGLSSKDSPSPKGQSLEEHPWTL